MDEIAFLLGHADGTVARRVYVQEVADERREKQRRQPVSESYAGLL